ncbi:serine/arginine repetitive matrix protein 2-like isoform X2 [Cimex lectularius]|uniref:Small acidic protein-like domain-containing protein n=1 Tax=Cimex lectularius TaxID=79782 RepID=A0A8I6S3X9_CIMLE|nr:serine/arginine repetitive matrix protein 2-like isoform X2 [Cimex lectularius]
MGTKPKKSCITSPTSHNKNTKVGPHSRYTSRADRWPYQKKEQRSSVPRRSRSRSWRSKSPRSRSSKSRSPRSRSPKSRSPRSRSTKSRSPRSRNSKSRSPKSRNSKSRSPRSRSPESRSSRSRSRSRSHSPWHNTHRHYRKRSDHAERYRDGDRDGDREKDKERSPPRRIYDRVAANKMCILEKLGIELKVPEPEKEDLQGNSFRERLGQDASRFQEQIAKRKLLWSRNQTKGNAPCKSHNKDTNNQNQWKDARFLHDQDGKLTAKFHRLMGMKSAGEGSSTSSDNTRKDTFAIKKQEELFSTMEMQYEAARNATHKQRGVGLGFSSHHFPR